MLAVWVQCASGLQESLGTHLFANAGPNWNYVGFTFTMDSEKGLGLKGAHGRSQKVCRTTSRTQDAEIAFKKNLKPWRLQVFGSDMDSYRQYVCPPQRLMDPNQLLHVGSVPNLGCEGQNPSGQAN